MGQSTDLTYIVLWLFGEYIQSYLYIYIYSKNLKVESHTHTHVNAVFASFFVNAFFVAACESWCNSIAILALK